MGPGCVKTHTSEKCRKYNSPTWHSTVCPQHYQFSYRAISQNTSTRAADVEVFTQPGSKANKPSRAEIFLCPLWSKSGQTRVRLDCPLSAKSGLMHCNMISAKKKDRLATVSPKSDQEFSASVWMRSANSSAVLAASAAGDSAFRSCQA